MPLIGLDNSELTSKRGNLRRWGLLSLELELHSLARLVHNNTIRCSETSGATPSFASGANTLGRRSLVGGKKKRPMEWAASRLRS